MTQDNLFEKAIEKDETINFFSGKDAYFVRDPDWGEHVYGAHLSGWAASFCKNSKEKEEIFNDHFISFFNQLETSQEGLNHLLGNLNAYISLRERSFFNTTSLFNKDSKEIKVIRDYISKLKKTEVYNNNLDYIKRSTDYFSESDYPCLSDALN